MLRPHARALASTNGNRRSPRTRSTSREKGFDCSTVNHLRALAMTSHSHRTTGSTRSSRQTFGRPKSQSFRSYALAMPADATVKTGPTGADSGSSGGHDVGGVPERVETDAGHGVELSPRWWRTRNASSRPQRYALQ